MHLFRSRIVACLVSVSDFQTRDSSSRRVSDFTIPYSNDDLFASLIVAGPTQCQECSADRDANDCTRSQRTQTCDKDSLGTTHCGSAKYKYQDVFGVHDGYIRGCINCAGL